jgi:dienelactone hydrolase
MLAWDDAISGSRPGVLVAHTIRGRTPFEEGKARDLAKLGYCALALDVYGQSALGGDDASNRAHMDALKADRQELQRRLLLSLRVLKEQPEVDSSHVAAMGFCFGGLCVLDIARTGEDLDGVISFHGLLDAPDNTSGGAIKARVLVLHGWDDPLATPDRVVALSDELTAMGADWQLHAYGNTMHAFTNPAANDKDRGTVFSAAANRRSWIAMRNFLDELFKG